MLYIYLPVIVIMYLCENINDEEVYRKYSRFACIRLYKHNFSIR